MQYNPRSLARSYPRTQEMSTSRTARLMSDKTEGFGSSQTYLIQWFILCHETGGRWGRGEKGSGRAL